MKKNIQTNMQQPFEPQNRQPPRLSWAQVASVSNQNMNSSPLHNLIILNKMKDSTTNFIYIDDEAMARARMKFQFTLYGKLFGKPPPFDQVKAALIYKWEGIGEVFISDLPNGFLLI